jgi:D-glycero-D-manno-heptose 1,7-bisphosphate phosphatase
LTSKPKTRRAVFLDRDGVVLELIEIKGLFTSIWDRKQIVYRPGLNEFLRNANGQGFLLCIVTNQPDISRGKQTLANVAAIHEQILTDNPLIDRIYFCPHDDHDLCSCRKPKPGLLTRSAAELNIDLQGSIVVGDRMGDLEAAKHAGCDFVLLRSQATSNDAQEQATLVGNNWSEVTEHFLARLSP